jgi:NADPH:quinone reductase-like Zn-dependent oxidoreductase
MGPDRSGDDGALMRAVVMGEFGDPGVLALADVPDPVPRAGEALVRVAAVEVSRTRDVAARSGRHPFSRQITLPHVLGGDFAGVVEAVGGGVDPALAGRRVAAMNSRSCGECTACRSGREYECAGLEMVGIHRWGSYAELTTVPAGSLHVLPGGIAMPEAAALAATGPIALTQLRVAAVAAGSEVLITGVTGALATVLAALAARLGARVTGLTRRVAAVPPGLAPGLGVTVLDSGREDLTAAIRGAAGGAGPDCVIDNVAAPEVFDRYFPALVNGARIVISGAIGTPDLPTLRVPAAPLYLRSISLIGVRTASARTTKDFWDLVREGFRLPPGLVHEEPLEAVSAVHDAVARGTAVGHTVLRVSDSVA